MANDEDWEGNNAAFTCPKCKKVYVVSGMIHRAGRKCPNCKSSTGYVSGAKKSGGTAYIEFDGTESP
jgi:Zn finger protein HypA/HybF involved in hydrogenase expression